MSYFLHRYHDDEKEHKFFKWSFTFNNHIFKMHTGKTARKELSLVPLSETFLDGQAEKTIEIIKDIFPYYIYTNKHNKDGMWNIPNDSYICFYNLNDPKARHIYVRVCDVYDNDTKWFVKNVLRRLGTANAAMSFCTYYKTDCKKASIFSINALVLDVDFLNSQEQFVKGTERWCAQQIIEEEHMNIDIPVPTYIENGRQFRYIYILKEPIYVANYSKTIKFAQKIMNIFADRLKYLGGDRQQLNSFVRMNGTPNVKGWEGHVEYKVEWQRYCDYKYTFQEIIDEFMPTLSPKNERKRKKSKAKKDKFRFSRAMDYQIHNQEVLSFLRRVQEYYNAREDYGHREVLCFLYRNYTYLLYGDQDRAEEDMLKFNSNFTMPLIEKEVCSATHNINYKQYLYSNGKLMETCDVTYRQLDMDPPSAASRKQYRHAYYMENEKPLHKERENRVKKIRSTVLKLKQKGKRNIDIVAALIKKGIALSEKSVERYVTTLRKEGVLCPT